MPQGKCPNNGCVLNYNEGDKFVDCPYCDTKHSIEELETNTRRETSKTESKVRFGAGAVPAILGFDNPESGVVFIQNFFDTYNWELFKETNELEIEEISEVVYNNKMKNGAVGTSWYIDFKAVSVPLIQKTNGLKDLAVKIGEKYNTQDASECMALFDIYRGIINNIVANKESIIKRLEAAVKYAQGFGLEANRLKEIQEELQQITSALNGIKEVKEIEQIPEYIAAQNKVSAELERKLLEEKGINARELYEEAVRLFEAGGAAKSSALENFEQIRGYKDTNKYIRKINNYFDINELFHFADKDFIYRSRTISVPALNVSELNSKKKGGQEQQAAQQERVLVLSLFEIIDGVPADKPLIENIADFITCYNNKYYFMRHNKGIYSFDLISHEEVCIDEGTNDDYYENGELQVDFALGGSTMYVMKPLHPSEAKKGCMGKSKQKPEEEKLLNNYCLLAVNLFSGKTEVVVKEFVDVAENIKDDKFFYILAERTAKAPVKGGCMSSFKKKKQPVTVEPEKDYETKLMVCDLATGENRPVLDESCKIENVIKGKIIYTIYKSNSLNNDLRVYDMNDGSDILIEDNVYKYFASFDDRIFYTVGNAEYRPLYSNSFAGGDRKELMANVESVYDVRAGWMYVTKGTKNNRIIVKVNMETGERVLVCYSLKKIVKSSPTHIYYLDTANNLRVVRRDGEENNIIGKDIRWSVIEPKELFYVRDEDVAYNVEGMSLYKMDSEGKNVKKLVFDIENAKNFDESTLYYVKKDRVRYKVTVPTGKDTKEEHYEFYNIERYFKFDKASGESEVVLTLGLPKPGKSSYKAGCLKKTVEADIQFEEAPIPREYKRRGLKAVGAVEVEQEEKQQNNTGDGLDLKSTIANTKSGCDLSGCLGSIKKK